MWNAQIHALQGEATPRTTPDDAQGIAAIGAALP